MLDIIRYSFGVGIRHWRIAAIVYFCQLCLALTLGLEVHNVLKSSIGNSLEINKLLNAYDHTVITDFLKVHGASITPLIGQLRWLLLAWLLFSVFLDAGLIYCVNAPDRNHGQAFFYGGAKYYFSFLKISLFCIVLALLWTALLWIPFGLAFEPMLTTFTSEAYAVWLALLLLGVYLLGLAFLFVWSVLSRFHRINTDSTMWQCLGYARRSIWRYKALILGLLGLFALAQIILVYLYSRLEHSIVPHSAFLLLLLFLLQQVFVFVRIQVRQMMYAGINRTRIYDHTNDHQPLAI